MKSREIKGLSAFELLEGLDDDMILSASLPEAAPVATPAAGEKVAAFFARMGKGGMAAAIATVVVALAVLTGVLLAGPRGIPTPSHTDTNHGIHGTQGCTEAEPNTNNGIVIPPITESPDNTQRSAVSVVSDGITVYPKGYCVYLSECKRNEDGEMDGVEADGMGAVYQLDNIWDELPTLRTAGNDYALNLPSNSTLRRVRVFKMVNGLEGIFEERALISDEMEDYRDRPWEFLSSILPSGDYIVVLEIYYETIYSEDEYTKGLDEYAFWLTVDRSMNYNSPVRVIHGDKTYFPKGYLLESTCYDAELKQYVTKEYDGAEKILKELVKEMLTATVPVGESLSLYLAPYYDIKTVKVYRDLTLWHEDTTEEPLTLLSEWEVGDYYFIFTVSDNGTGETTVTEFPIHIKVAEEPEEETYPNDDGETPEPPRLTVSTGFGSLYFGNANQSSEYHGGYMLWVEEWHDGGMLCGDGFGAEGQLADILGELPTVEHYSGESVSVHVIAENDSVIGLKVCTPEGERIVVKSVSNVLDLLSAMNSLNSVEEGTYVVILTVVTQGDYIPEAEAYERTCTEYAFVLKVVEEQAGIPGVPETNPRVTVSGGGQSAVFATEEDGFLAWREVDLSHIEGTRATDVIFTDNDAMRALPKMEIFYGDTLTLTLDAAGDDLIMVYLYDAKGGFIHSRPDLSVIEVLQNEGWDQHVIVILETVAVVSETERVCYEYAFELDIIQP